MARSTLLSPIGALGFYHRGVFLPVLTRAFADFSWLSLLSPKMRSQSLLEIPLNPTRKRSWCSSVFGFGFGVDVDVGVGVDVDVMSMSGSSRRSFSLAFPPMVITISTRVWSQFHLIK